MIDLTPIEVRKKSGDFKKGMLGYDPREVEDFLSLAADRMEELIKENAALSREIVALEERAQRLQQQVTTHEERQNAVQEALIMAQKLREDVRAQAERDAEIARQKADADIKKSAAESQRGLEDSKRRFGEMELRRRVFLQSFRAFLQKELEQVQKEEAQVSGAADIPAEPAPEPDDPNVSESIRADVLAALEAMPLEAQAAAESAVPEPPAAAPEPSATAEAKEDPWISALQEVAPYKKPEAGPSN